ncbi:MAG: VCBS repeat-containing protein [Akkermansiaceae bacterium]|nr:VCBS repeat-containing protein [Akkermansiaceae bacterium]MCF7732201.1 VCBS repeat-containing protein [Akkermansiaceae bacterium]
MTMPRMTLVSLIAGSLGAVAADSVPPTPHSFRKLVLTDEFWCEGAYFGDFNHDGAMDVCGGPFWWQGPDFKIRHEYRPADKTTTAKRPDGTEVTFPGYSGAKGAINDYSDNFLTYADDFNGDGWTDIIVYGLPGTDAYWYENPKAGAAGEATQHWARHQAVDTLDNESPRYGDINGDGKPDAVCNSKGFLGFASADPEHPAQPWAWHSISPKGSWHKYTHGVGFGDVNGDGRADFLEQNGWWEQPGSLAGDPVWKSHPFPFAAGSGTAGGAQMHVVDFNNDHLNDVLTTLDPHGYGLVWYEQTRDHGPTSFKPHTIVGKQAADSKYGVVFSQAHAIELADIDGDGIQDFITGKRFWAHGPTGDVEPNAPAVLYWFKTVRNPDKSVDFIPYLIDSDSGVGTQVAAADLNGDGLPEVIVGNKKGVFVFMHELAAPDRK